ncbi:hypothetical protein [Lacipirellula sp.]|uniref:hypothetical protein n=1 Tax=Lacipirellula sp. TaxID=2691419 RepID=UPI003D1178F6
MDRAFRLISGWAMLACIGLGCVASTGCISMLMATGIYMWNGGNTVEAECDKLEKERVVVLCRPPASHEFRNAGAARSIGSTVSGLIAEHVKGAEMVSPKEVDNWVDEQDWENFKDLGRAVKATRIVYIELDDFELYKGKTLYQGRAEITVSVYDMEDRERLVFERQLGQVLFPRNSGIPSSDKPVQQFERQFVDVISVQIAEHFYRHTANADYALDSVANH